MQLTFVANKAKCNSLVKRLCQEGVSCTVEPFDIPIDGAWEPLEMFARVFQVRADVSEEMALKALKWASDAGDGTHATVSSGNYQEALDRLTERYDLVVEARVRTA